VDLERHAKKHLSGEEDYRSEVEGGEYKDIYRENKLDRHVGDCHCLRRS